MVVRLRVAEGELAVRRFDPSERLRRREIIVGAIGCDASPYRIGKQLGGLRIVTAIEGEASLLVGREPHVREPAAVFGTQRGGMQQ